MEWMKINVFKNNEFSVKFDMITDDLPEPGEHLLIPADKVHLFVMDYFKIMIDKVISADKILYRMAQVEHHIRLIYETKKDKDHEDTKEREQPSS